MLLGSFGWQCIEMQLQDDYIKSSMHYMNLRLDQIWGAEKVICETVKCEQYKGSISLDFNWWPPIEMHVLKNVEQQSSSCQTIRIILYVLGSLCIIYGKFYEKHKTGQGR